MSAYFYCDTLKNSIVWAIRICYGSSWLSITYPDLNFFLAKIFKYIIIGHLNDHVGQE